VRRLWRLAATAALAAGLVAAAPAEDEERILDFAVVVTLSGDTDFDVSETIAYDFGSQARHGIYRDVPVAYERPGGADWRADVEVLEVTDATGAPQPWQTSRRGRDLRIRIGDPDRTLTGRQEYRIRYRVSRALLYFETHDELYWNVTGNGWPVPIERARAEVYLPERHRGVEVELACFTGPFGASFSNCRSAREGGVVGFVTTRALANGEGLTLVVGLPKGVLRKPSAWERRLARLRDYASGWLLLPFATFLAMWLVWRAHGRDPGARDAIPVRYEPPEGLSPAEVGTLLDESADIADVTATILDLAVRGYLSLREEESTSFLFFSKTDWVLEKRSGGAGDLKPHERALYSALFRGRESVRVSELRNQFYRDLPEVKQALYRELSSADRYFPVSPDEVRRLWVVGAALALGLAVFAGSSGRVPLSGTLALGASAVVVGAFGTKMPRRTRRGRQAYEAILGFKEFVSRADADRLERLAGRSSETFEKVLPFAMVLGCADAWADAFADVYTKPPSWYHTTGTRPFRSDVFVSDLGRSLQTLGAAMTSSPSSRGGSGGSGLGGGGSSGGGFGGGGGGSW
jgi:uncharacterized membrane protein YgcG